MAKTFEKRWDYPFDIDVVDGQLLPKTTVQKLLGACSIIMKPMSLWSDANYTFFYMQIIGIDGTIDDNVRQTSTSQAALKDE